jgi:predicted nucleic-acid-binding protein
VRITSDTNVLVRVLTEDDETQTKAAQRALERADLVALTLPALCELVWVLVKGYKIQARDVGASIRTLINGANVAVDRPAVDAGLAVLDAGGDFADGVIAHQGRWLGADVFVSFDRKAVDHLQASGQSTQIPS